MALRLESYLFKIDHRILVHSMIFGLDHHSCIRTMS